VLAQNRDDVNGVRSVSSPATLTWSSQVSTENERKKATAYLNVLEHCPEGLPEDMRSMLRKRGHPRLFFAFDERMRPRSIVIACSLEEAKAYWEGVRLTPFYIRCQDEIPDDLVAVVPVMETAEVRSVSDPGWAGSRRSIMVTKGRFPRRGEV